MPYDAEITDKNNSGQEVNVDGHPNLFPYIGMELNSLNDVKEFYTSFAKKEGFEIRARTSKENFYILMCSSEGRHTSKSANEEENNVCLGKIKKKVLNFKN